MKNIIKLILLLVFIVSCNKKDRSEYIAPLGETGSVTFYTDDKSKVYNLHLDNRNYGKLVVDSLQPACGDSKFLTLKLAKGIRDVSLSPINVTTPANKIQKIEVVPNTCTVIKVRL